MSTSAAQAAAFFKEVTSGATVWTVRDVEGFAAPLEGRRSTCDARLVDRFTRSRPTLLLVPPDSPVALVGHSLGGLLE